jgi:hypothetical protein
MSIRNERLCWVEVRERKVYRAAPGGTPPVGASGDSDTYHLIVRFP